MKLTNQILAELSQGVSHHEFGGPEIVQQLASELLKLQERWDGLKNYVKVEQRAMELAIKKPSHNTDRVNTKTLNDFNNKKYDWKTLSPETVQSVTAELQDWRELNQDT
tara:strand:+ start:3187 stop:3513 length:327 start_codon:yes stop_codon:yes gene_type:complete